MTINDFLLDECPNCEVDPGWWGVQLEMKNEFPIKGCIRCTECETEFDVQECDEVDL